MIATKEMRRQYAAWNRQWHAPFGRRTRGRGRLLAAARRAGPFAYQANSTTRAVEYPWVAERVAAAPGQRILEIGGGHSGLQFVFAKAGASVVNVDPMIDYGGADHYGAPEAKHAWLNRAFGTNVELRRTTLDRAGLGAESVDVAVCVSTIEHLDLDTRMAVCHETYRALRPGGDFVLTVDLFLDLVPFSDRTSNQWGGNADVAALVAAEDWELRAGSTGELLGYSAFDPRSVLGRLAELEMGDYPVLAQLLVVRKPS